MTTMMKSIFRDRTSTECSAAETTQNQLKRGTLIYPKLYIYAQHALWSQYLVGRKTGKLLAIPVSNSVNNTYT